MNNLQLGKMYCVKQYFWLLFPMKKLVRTKRPSISSSWAYRDAKWYSELNNCNVAVVEKNTCFVLLEQDKDLFDKDLFKVLDSNGNIGWICCYDFSKCFELVKE